MVDFTPWDATTHTVVELEDDWNNLLAHGLEKTAAYIIRKNGSYYEAVKGYGATTGGNVAYGGSGDAGGTGGTVFEDVVEAAITAAAGKRVHIAAGSYALLDEIDIGQAGTWITGEGYGTQITQGTADKHGFKITTKTNVRISNLLLNGTGAGTGSGIYGLTTSTGLTVDHCVITNFGYHGIHVASSNYPLLTNNYIYSNIRNGLNLDTVNYGRVLGNRVVTNTRHGAWLQDSSYNLVSANQIVGNDSADAATYDGVNINHSGATSDYNQIVNNTISNNDRYEINISTASCTGNRVYPNNTYGTDRTAILADSGTDTIMGTVIVPFSEGHTYNVQGFDIDAAGE